MIRTSTSFPLHRFITCRFYFPYVFHRTEHNSAGSGTQNASDKLFADAAREEAEAKSTPRAASRLPLLEQQHANWDGDESINDAVLRMLVDKYKPLRSGTIQSADQKLKQAPPQIASSDSRVLNLTDSIAKPASGSWATEPLLPSKEGHQPWHTKFTGPSRVDVDPLVQTAHGLSGSIRRGISASPKDDRTRRKEKEAVKRTQQAGRLTNAKESTLDYRLGLGVRSKSNHRSNPVTMKGWNSLVEEKIEEARKAGAFNTIKGRGKSIVQNIDETNPFIAREEFLMNRIVQRNGAVPPWVDIQKELDTAVSTFRLLLRQSWTRRAIRILTSNHPREILYKFTSNDVKALRDAEWEQREKAYHKVAIEQVNSLVRKYNGLAPYTVRRPYYVLETEIGKLYDACAEDILRALAERVESRSELGGTDDSTVGRLGDAGPGWKRCAAP